MTTMTRLAVQAPMQPPCHGHSALFDSTDLADHYQAVLMCDTCPLRDGWCLDRLGDAIRDSRVFGSHLAHPTGTWAGQLYGAKGRPTRVPRQRCGGCGKPMKRGRIGTVALLPKGYVYHAGRGLCRACYQVEVA